MASPFIYNQVYRLEEYNEVIDVILVFDAYKINGTLAVSLYTADDGELYDVITVNLPESSSLPEDVQFVDVNNHPTIPEWLIGNGLAEPYPATARSGYCEYPAFRFLK